MLRLHRKSHQMHGAQIQEREHASTWRRGSRRIGGDFRRIRAKVGPRIFRTGRTAKVRRENGAALSGQRLNLDFALELLMGVSWRVSLVDDVAALPVARV